MINHILYVIVLSILMLMACDNNNQSGENKIVEEEAPRNNGSRDGTSNKLFDNESAKDRGIIRRDTTLPGPTNTKIVAELPGKVAEEIQIDPKLKNHQLIKSGSYEEKGNTYYELTFDDQTKVTFDRQGNRQSQ